MKKGHGSQFDRLLHRAIAALLKPSATAESAAREIGVSHNTLLRWMKEPEFKTAYREAISAEYSQATSRLRQGTPAAATTILKNMVDPKASHAVRQRAAEWVLDRGANAIEEDLTARVEELERLLPERIRPH